MENKVFTCPCCGHDALVREECEACGYNPDLDGLNDDHNFNDQFAAVDEYDAR